MSIPPSEYDKLRALWYEKLKEEGFKDIESMDGKIKVWSSSVSRKNPPDIWQAKAAYYRMATSFLHDYTFENAVEKTIWEYHAFGISIRDIVATLNATKVIKTNRDAVWIITKRLENAMKNMYMSDSQDDQ